MIIQRVLLVCLDCGLVWRDEILGDVVVPLWIAAVKVLRCPMCGAGWKRIGIHEAKPPKQP